MQRGLAATWSRLTQALPVAVVFVALAGLMVVTVLHFRLGRMSPGVFGTLLAMFSVLIPALIRRAARTSRERHRRKLEQLRGKPVLHLND